MPINRITDLVASPAATTWLASADRPIVASTPEKASSTGSPAATSAPNAISRISSVTGTVEYSARWKSFVSVLFSSWVELANPNSATVNPGWRSWTCATASSTGCTFLSALS